jgi:uncharacterized protein (DUF1330 family)
VSPRAAHASTNRAYAVAILRNVDLGPAIFEYLEQIDVTLAPFGGRFLVHGATTELLEGAHPGDVVIIEFPDRERAVAWYASDAYQAIVPLRTDHSDSTVVVLEGVGPDYAATDFLPKIASTA